MRAFPPIVTLALLCVAAAVPSGFEGAPVVAIRYLPRDQPFAEQLRAGRLPVAVGKPLDPADVRESIRALFSSGRYANVEVEAEPAEGGVEVVFRMELNRFIGAVAVDGAPSPPTRTQAINATKLRPGQMLTPAALGQARQNLRRLYLDNGFASPVVEVVEIPDVETQQVDLSFLVRVGERAGVGALLLTGDRAFGEAEAREIAKWPVGRPLTDPRVEEGLTRLRESLHERDRWQAEVSVVGRDFNPDANQLDLVVHVRQGPRVDVRVEGYSFPPKLLRRLVPVFEEGAVDDDLLSEGATSLRDYLQGQGYFDAEVDFDRERTTEEEIVVVYRVEPGARQRLDRLTITGARYFDLETIRERLLIQPSSLQLRRGRFSRRLLERDLDGIRRLYRTNGFRDVEVDARIARTREARMSVEIAIREGRPTLVEDLRVEGIDGLPGGDFRYSTSPGQPFSETSVATDRDLILARYFDSGFQDASFEWRVEPGSEPRRVVVRYRVREGEQVFVNRPIVSGLERTRPDLVRTRILLEPGAPLSQSAMFESQRRLYDLGVFSKVDVALQNPDGDEPRKNVLFQLEEARRWTFGFGGGAEFARIGGGRANVSSPVGAAAFSPRVTLEATRLNVRGRGHTLAVRSRFSNLQQRALVTYSNPRWTDSDKWTMTMSGLWDTSRNVRTFTSARLEGVFQLEHRLSRASTGLYRYTYRRTAIDGDTLQISPLLIPLNAQPVRAGLLSGTFIQDRRDDPTDSTRGVFNTVDLSIASGYWGSQPDFVRFFGQNSTYHRIGRKVVLARTIQFGVIQPWSDTDVRDDPATRPPFFSAPDPRVPIAERFFAGGANSHRGFPFNQAGPRDPVTGFPIGGAAELLSSVELRFPLLGENIGGVLFHDAGNVYSQLDDLSLRFNQRSEMGPDGQRVYDFDYMVQAVGFGLRYRTPIGPVRVDLGYPLNPPRFIGFAGTREQLLSGQGLVRDQRIPRFQFHFSLGQTF